LTYLYIYIYIYLYIHLYVYKYNCTYTLQVILSAPHGLASDVWSLGCLLYTMLVGVSTFRECDLLCAYGFRLW